MSEYYLNNGWVFDAGDDVHGRINAAGAWLRRSVDPDITTTFTAGF